MVSSSREVDYGTQDGNLDEKKQKQNGECNMFFLFSTRTQLKCFYYLYLRLVEKKVQWIPLAPFSLSNIYAITIY